MQLAAAMLVNTREGRPFVEFWLEDKFTENGPTNELKHDVSFAAQASNVNVWCPPLNKLQDAPKVRGSEVVIYGVNLITAGWHPEPCSVETTITGPRGMSFNPSSQWEHKIITVLVGAQNLISPSWNP